MEKKLSCIDIASLKMSTVASCIVKSVNQGRHWSAQWNSESQLLLPRASRGFTVRHHKSWSDFFFIRPFFLMKSAYLFHAFLRQKSLDIGICLGLGGAAITRGVRSPRKWLPTRENPQPQRLNMDSKGRIQPMLWAPRICLYKNAHVFV